MMLMFTFVHSISLAEETLFEPSELSDPERNRTILATWKS